MKKKILKYSLITIGCIVILLAITNPSVKQFKEYLGGTHSVRRTTNWIIFSSYEALDKQHVYFAIFNNFFETDEVSTYISNR